MAQVTTNAPLTQSLWDMLSRGFTAIGEVLVQMAESSSQMRQISALQALSDGELSERGLKRDDIPRYVFSGSYWV